MNLFLFLLFAATISAYEKIRIFSDNDSIIQVKRPYDTSDIIIETQTKIGASYKTFSQVHLAYPEGLEGFEFVFTDEKLNTGRYPYESPFTGVYLSLTYDHRRPLTGLCELFSTLLPCFNVKQCNTEVENSVYDIDLDDAVWTPVDLVPYSFVNTMVNEDKDWVRVARFIIPSAQLHMENYFTQGCPASVYNNEKLFNVTSTWYPHRTDVGIRFIKMALSGRYMSDFNIYDSVIFPGPLRIPDRLSIDTPTSTVDLIIYNIGAKGEIERTTASGRKVMYPEREYPFWTGSLDFDLSSTDQLTISGPISAAAGTYNPRYTIYDSRTAMVLYLPRGVYVELAELALMYQAGKIPAYISYQEFVDTDACYEEAGPQLLVFIAEASIYPLPPQLDVNITLPIHRRASRTAKTEFNVTIPIPHMYAQSPVRDSIMINSQPVWWQPAYPTGKSLDITIPVLDEYKRIRDDKIALGMICICVCILVVEVLRKLFGGKEKEE